MTPSAIPACLPEPRPSWHTFQQRSAAQLVPKVERMARKLARRLPPSVLVEDLVGAASLGLANALRNREAAASHGFEFFALEHARCAMLSELRRLDPLTRHQRTRMRQVEAALEQLSGQDADACDPADVARAAGLTEQQYWDALRAHHSSAALSLQSWEETWGAVSADCGPDGASQPEPADEVVDRARQWERVCKAVEALPERLRLVLHLHVAQGLKFSEIARQLGVTESRVSQLRSEAIERLKLMCPADPASPAGPPGPSVH